jgi:hypothetical protein
VATTFLNRFGDGEFDAADELLHTEGPLEGASEAAIALSILLTDFLATALLRSIPTTVADVTLVEQGPTTARVDATVDVADLAALDASVELRPEDADGTDDSTGRTDDSTRRTSDSTGRTDDSIDGRGDWRVWNVDLEL